MSISLTIPSPTTLGTSPSNGSGSPNVYNNEISDWTNWQFPTKTYHTDGIIAFGDSSVPSPSIYDNFIHGDLGSGSPTGFIFCSYGVQGNGNGSSEPDSQPPTTRTSTPQRQRHEPPGPHYVYNNTIVGFMFQIYAQSDSTINYTIENNIFLGNG